MITLQLFDRLAEGTGSYRMDLTRHARNWARTIRAVGGFWTGDFEITSTTMGRLEMVNFYNTAIGQRVAEKTAGITTWEGEIVEMILSLDGVQYKRTLNPNQFQNKVKVRYPAGVTAYSEKTGSSDVYGESVAIDVVGASYDSTAAAARRDRILAEKAYPRSRPSGGLSSNAGAEQSETFLSVLCAGYVFSMNRRYQESDVAATNVSDQISTLVGNSEFVSAGRIDSNTLSVPVSVEGIPSRLWDLIEEMIDMGDASGNRWVGGCYAGREFHYEAAETAVSHRWRNGQLVDLGGVPMIPSTIRPNIIVELDGSPAGAVLPGGNVWDNPKRAYIEEVEFMAPNIYRLVPRGGAS